MWFKLQSDLPVVASKSVPERTAGQSSEAEMVPEVTLADILHEWRVLFCLLHLAQCIHIVGTPQIFVDSMNEYIYPGYMVQYQYYWLLICSLPRKLGIVYNRVVLEYSK